MAFKLENLWYAAVMIVVSLTVILAFYGNMLSNYSITGDTSKFGKVSTSLKGIYDPGLDMKSQIQGGTISSGDAVNNMVSGGYTAIRNNPFTVGSTALNVTGTIIQESELGINPIFYWAAALLLMTTIAFGIIYMVFRYIRY